MAGGGGWKQEEARCRLMLPAADGDSKPQNRLDVALMCREFTKGVRTADDR